MRFIHLADVHLGAVPDRGCPWSKEREEEIWNTFRRVIAGIRQDPVDLLFISGDLFHRQPLMRELKEVNYLFSTIPDTRVYLMAGNHDFISRDSFYNTFEWNSNVTFFKNRELTYVKDSKLDVYVYGLSYYDREIKEGLYDKASPIQEEGIHILLAHGGDEKHIPLSAASLAAAGFDYIALGHIHKPQILIRDQAAFSGALEPIDRNDTGDHGYMEGRLINGRIRTEFVPFACRSYQELTVKVGSEMSLAELRAKLCRLTMSEEQNRDFYRIRLEGSKHPGQEFCLEELDESGRILKLEDQTHPDYDFERLAAENRGNLLGEYIASFLDTDTGRDGTGAHDLGTPEMGTLERMALYEGVKALLGE